MLNTIQQFEEYFNGSRKTFNLKIKLDKTGFSQNVLLEVKNILSVRHVVIKTLQKI